MIVEQDAAYNAILRMVRCLDDYQQRMQRVTHAIEIIDTIGHAGAPSETFRVLMRARRHLLRALEMDGARAVEFVELAWQMRDVEQRSAA